MLRLVLVCAVLSFALVGGVAAFSPFDTLPRDHWAYDAVEQLGCDWFQSIGFCHDASQPLQTQTRYVFAVTTARIHQELLDSDKARRGITFIQLTNLIWLMDEFRPEVAALGLDVDVMKRQLPYAPSVKRLDLNAGGCPELAEMSRDHWAYASMKLLYQLGIFQGCPRG